MADRRGISSFSVLLLTAVTAVAGIACISQLKVQYTPAAVERTIEVTYSYPDASARTVEAEVTSRIEGVLAGIRGCTDISSVSRDEEGLVSLTVGKHADINAVRFEVASKIRNLWTGLPQQCSYPEISMGVGGGGSRTAISFDIRSPLPSREISRFVEEYLMYPLSKLEGVGDVEFYGDTPYEWVITFDADAVQTLGLTAADLRSAITEYYADEVIGMTRSGGNMFGVKLRSAAGQASEPDFSAIPVKKVGSRIVHLGDVASFRYQESLPDTYYRINGLNTLILTIGVEPDANLLSVVKSVKEEMTRLQEGFPSEISVRVSYDSSEYVRDELDKIYFRTALCLLILLLFVFVVSRSWRYMVVMALTLAVNLSVSVAFYFLLGLHIHIYTLAGITVSLGIIIDNSIVMIDHWSRYRNRSVFPALLSAVLTTVAALLVILLLPEREKANLTDFSYVIVINLCVSLAVAYLFVPALLDHFPVEGQDRRRTPVRRLRRIVRWNCLYEKYIGWGIRHRWVLVAAFVVAFGIPTFLLPKEFGDERRAPLKSYEKALNKVVGWRPYSDNKHAIDKALGSSFALFNDALSRSDFYREPVREKLYISAGMPEGCSVQQLNEVIRNMENYLSSIPDVELFETLITSPREGDITVLFKPEVEKGWIPHKIKSDVISMAGDFGGANWVVTGLDENFFNNNVVTDIRSNGITLTGYNYDDLLAYGEKLKAHLSAMRRVADAEIWGGDYHDRPATEFGVSYDFSSLAALGISPYSYWGALYSPLYNASVVTVPQDGNWVEVRLESSERDRFDVWHVENTSVAAGDGKMKLSEIGDISKGRTGLPIRRHNQSYSINVKFNFIGSYRLARKLTDETVEYMNNEVLPIGYKAESEEYGWFFENKEKYAGLILLVIAIIFVICSVHFNSIRYPVAIIWMIPIAFIGVFLTFGMTDFTFDKGGFAAFVMLSGITVNAGIYLVSTWKQEALHSRADGKKLSDVHQYIRAFNHKIWPISLTILSTLLGLVPFLLDGPEEVFWFPFAVGTISGLVFSMIAFILYLPVFCISSHRN